MNDNLLPPHFKTQKVVMQTVTYIEKLFNSKDNVINIDCGNVKYKPTLDNKPSILLHSENKNLKKYLHIRRI